MGMWNTKGKANQSKEIKQYWFVMINVEGFESTMIMYGTQTELWYYMRNSFHYSIPYRYRNASEEEVETAKKLGVKAYIC